MPETAVVHVLRAISKMLCCVREKNTSWTRRVRQEGALSPFLTMRLYLFLLLQAVAAHEAPRYWPKFGGTREVTTLDGEWDYGYIDGGDGSSSKFDAMSKFHPKDISTPKKMAVPSCMDVVAGGASGYLGPRGTAFYRTSFETPSKSRSVRLQFQSCSFYCRVFVNGEEVTPVTTRD